MKKVFAIVLALVMVVPTVAWANLSSRTVGDMRFWPIRLLFEENGGNVTWNGEDNSIHITLNDGEMVLFIGQRRAYINGEAFNLQDGVRVIQGTSYISDDDLSFLLTNFLGATVLTFHLTEEARDIVLSDFDYMVELILENSPWDGVLYRRLGLVFEDHVAHNRNNIENMYPIVVTVMDEDLLREAFPIRDEDDPRSIAANYLFALLAFEFAPPMMGIGHLMPRDLSLYIPLLTGFLRAYNQEGANSENAPILHHFVEAFTHPSVIWFYGEHEVNLDAEYYVFPEIPDNIETEVIVPGEVAYLRINSFISNPYYDDRTILPFLQEVQDFDHLIIDIRGNAGGLMSYFNEYVLRRIISEPIEVGSYEFFSSGDMASKWMNAYAHTAQQVGSLANWQELIYSGVMPATDFIQERGMEHFNEDDLARLDYVFVSRYAIIPSEDNVGFDGKVWLLIDGGSQSASSMVAKTALYTGFATVVGENTSGVMASVHSYSVLPGTGILWRIDIGYVTDADGRSFEVYGVSPQIRNRPRLNALDTVLEIISERN